MLLCCHVIKVVVLFHNHFNSVLTQTFDMKAFLTSQNFNLVIKSRQHVPVSNQQPWKQNLSMKRTCENRKVRLHDKFLDKVFEHFLAFYL